MTIRIKLPIYGLAIAFMVLGSTPSLQAQEFDTLKRAKEYPPHMLGEQQSARTLEIIEWKQSQLESTRSALFEQDEIFSGRTKKLERELDKLTDLIPVGQRGIDSTVRSTIAGNILQESLNANLDLVTLRSKADQLSKRIKESKASENTEVAFAELDYQAARKKYQFAKESASRDAQLAEKGSISATESAKSKFAVEIAGLEVEKAKGQLRIAARIPQTEAARELADIRVEIAAISDRLVYAEETLKSFTKTEDLLAKRERIKRDIQNREQDRRLIATELHRLRLEIQELASMKDVFSSALTKMKDKKAPVEEEKPLKEKE